MKSFIFFKISLFLCSYLCLADKETILLRKIDATDSVKSLNPASLKSYLEALPTHFANYLNETGRFAVVDLVSIFKESNLDLELDNSAVFKLIDQKLQNKPKYILNCTVTAFVEKQEKVNNPLDGGVRINRDIFVSATMQLVNRGDASDQKVFQVPDYSVSWDEDRYDDNDGSDLIRLKKIEAFAKKSAQEMAKSFMSNYEHKIYVYEKIGNQCTILAGNINGVKVGQVYEVGITKKIIHPVTKKLMTGTTFTKIGLIKVLSTQSDVSTCEIIEDAGINTDVDGEILPQARLVSKNN